MKKWEEGLCDCTNNMGVCLLVWCIPGALCCVQASAVNKVTQGGSFVPYILVWCLGYIGGTINRENIRNRLDLVGSCGNSLFVWCYCCYCAACQEYREVNYVKQ